VSRSKRQGGDADTFGRCLRKRRAHPHNLFLSVAQARSKPLRRIHRLRLQMQRDARAVVFIQENAQLQD
jgi:hypothetical protein